MPAITFYSLVAMEQQADQSLIDADTINLRKDVVRIDGPIGQVSNAFDTLVALGAVSSVASDSPLCLSHHPQSQTALDLATSNIDKIRALLTEHGFHNVSAENPPLDESDLDLWA